MAAREAYRWVGAPTVLLYNTHYTTTLLYYYSIPSSRTPGAHLLRGLRETTATVETLPGASTVREPSHSVAGNVLHCVTLQHSTLHFITLHYRDSHGRLVPGAPTVREPCATTHLMSLTEVATPSASCVHYLTLHYITLYYIPLHFIASRCITFQFISLHCIALH